MGAHLPEQSETGSHDLALMSEINVTPFVDVMLVLLIIFMVTAPLMLSNINVDMPETTAARKDPPNDPLVISLDANGSLYVQDQAIDRANLSTHLQQLPEDQKSAVTYIRADKSIPYGTVAELLSDVSSAGIKNISLLMKWKQEK